jgi:hypothetical protein
MICLCGEKAFTFTSFEAGENGKINKILKGRCNKFSEDNTKKKVKCSFREEHLISVEPNNFTQLKSVVNKKITKKPVDHKYELWWAIVRTDMAQKNNLPFEVYLNLISYHSSRLNIPPFDYNKQTISEYYNIAKFYIDNPKPVKPEIKTVNYPLKLIHGFDDILKVNLRTNSKKIKQKKKITNFNIIIHDEEIENEEEDDESEEGQNDEDNTFDVEEFNSEDEEDIDDEYEILSD